MLFLFRRLPTVLVMVMLSGCYDNDTALLPLDENDAGLLPLQGTLYITTYTVPGYSYSYDFETGTQSPLYERPNDHTWLHSVAIDPLSPDELYFVNANRFDILKIDIHEDGADEELVYNHETYVRRLFFSDDGYLYFSEATGAGGDGEIWRLDENGTLEHYYTVQIHTIDGFWAGDFVFDSDGNLFVSSGNRIPSALYAIDMETDAVEKLLCNPDGSTRGMAFYDYDHLFYVADKTTINLLSLESNETEIVYETDEYELLDVLWLLETAE